MGTKSNAKAHTWLVALILALAMIFLIPAASFAEGEDAEGEAAENPAQQEEVIEEEADAEAVAEEVVEEDAAAAEVAEGEAVAEEDAAAVIDEEAAAEEAAVSETADDDAIKAQSGTDAYPISAEGQESIGVYSDMAYIYYFEVPADTTNVQFTDHTGLMEDGMITSCFATADMVSETDIAPIRGGFRASKEEMDDSGKITWKSSAQDKDYSNCYCYFVMDDAYNMVVYFIQVEGSEPEPVPDISFTVNVDGKAMTDMTMEEDAYTYHDYYAGDQIVDVYTVKIPYGTMSVDVTFSDNVLTYNYTKNGEYLGGYYPGDTYMTGSTEATRDVDMSSSDWETGDEIPPDGEFDYMQVQTPYDENYNSTLLYCITFEYADPTMDDATYTKGVDTDLEMTCDANHEALTEVLWDGEEVDSSSFEVTKGSTVVTFSQEFMEGQDLGEHSVTLKYGYEIQVRSDDEITTKASVLDGGAVAEATVTVQEAEEEPEDNPEENNEETTDEETTDGAAATDETNGTSNGTTDGSPATGDNDAAGIALILLALGAATAVAVRRKMTQE